MPDNKWARLLSYVTGLVNQKLLLQNEYLAAKNRILRAHLPARMRLSDPERSTLAEIGKRLGRAALQQVAYVAKPDTILAWYRRLIEYVRCGAWTCIAAWMSTEPKSSAAAKQKIVSRAL